MAGGALSGLLVVAIEQAVAAPLCTARLADAGARVIKIEREGGETARHYDRVVGGASTYFAWLNRGKESAALDLKSKGDRALLETMLQRADVLVQNLAPGAAARMGLDAHSAVLRFPRLVGVDIVGYGSDTSCREMRAYDFLVQAESGLCSVTGSPAERAKVGVSAADIATGMTAHAAILEALLARERTGQGAALEIAMFDVLADWMSVPLLHHELGDKTPGRRSMAHDAIYPYQAFACADGEIVIAVQAPAEWIRFCDKLLGDPELAREPRFADNPARVRNREALETIISAVLSRISRAEAIARLDAGQIAWGRVSTLADLSQHAALRRTELEAPDGSTVAVPRPGGRQGGLPHRLPGYGEHTAAIREEFGPR